MHTVDNSKNLSPDRLLILELAPGTVAKDSKGLADPRIFTGENKMHILQDEHNLWHFKYEKGMLPPYLSGQKFTKFTAAFKYVEDYFNKRNVLIKDVVNA